MSDSSESRPGSSASRLTQLDLADIAEANIPWSDLGGATVLVTGGTGLLGGWLVEALLTARPVAGDPVKRVVVVCRSIERAQRRFQMFPSSTLAIVEHGLDGPFEFEQQVDFVIHAASPATPTAIAADPVGTY